MRGSELVSGLKRPGSEAKARNNSSEKFRPAISPFRPFLSTPSSQLRKPLFLHRSPAFSHFRHLLCTDPVKIVTWNNFYGNG
ncbi:hypothetical protein P8452_66687 [Trifolium repens]|nr:hypothetical protein P8452_66687 [Trifolium repens]